MRPRNPRAEDASLQRFFQRALTVRGEFFCCIWNVACCLDTIEHMDGDKYWRSVCSLGMSTSAVLSALLMMLACSADYSWSRISEGVVLSTQQTIHSSTGGSGSISNSSLSGSNNTDSDSSSANSSWTDVSTLWHRSNADSNDSFSDDDSDSTDDNDNDSSDSHNKQRSRHGGNTMLVQDEVVTHRRLELNLWHIKLCSANFTNESIYQNETRVIGAQKGETSSNVNGVTFWSRINGTSTRMTNKSCSTRDNYDHDLDHSDSINVAKQFCIFFMISGLTLQLMAAICISMTHPWFDRLHNWDVGLKSVTSRMLGFSVVCMCACVLCWTSFVFARILQTENDNFDIKWQNQTNFNTGMASLNAALLVTIILSVIHCASPLRKIEDRYRRRSSNRHHRGGVAGGHGRNGGTHRRRRRRRGSSVGPIAVSTRRMRELQRRRHRRHSYHRDRYYSRSSVSSDSTLNIAGGTVGSLRRSSRSRDRDRYYSLAGHSSAIESLEFENRMWRRRRRRSRGGSWDPHRRRYAASLTHHHRTSSSMSSHNNTNNNDGDEPPMVAMVTITHPSRSSAMNVDDGDANEHSSDDENNNIDDGNNVVSERDLTRIRQGLVSLGLDTEMISDSELIMQQRLLDRYAAQAMISRQRSSEHVTADVEQD